MNKPAQFEDNIHTIVTDLEKKMITTVMQAIVDNRELLTVVMPHNNEIRVLSTISIILTAAMSAITSTASYMRSMSADPEKRADKSVIFDDDDIATAFGYLASLMQSRLSDTPIRDVDRLSDLTEGVTKAMKPLIQIGTVRAP